MSNASHDQDPDVEIGRIAGVFGIQGELKLEPYASTADRYSGLTNAVATFPDGRRIPVRVVGARKHKSHILLRFEGIASPNDAEPFIGSILVVPLSERPALPRGQYYISDLLGMNVITTSGEEVGPITDVLHTREHDVYVTPRGMIPAVKEFVRDVDMDKCRVVISPIEGLLSPTTENADED